MVQFKVEELSKNYSFCKSYEVQEVANLLMDIYSPGQQTYGPALAQN